MNIQSVEESEVEIVGQKIAKMINDGDTGGWSDKESEDLEKLGAEIGGLSISKLGLRA